MTATTPTFDRAVTRPPIARRRRGIMAAILGLTTLSLGAGVFSLAIFTDTQDATGSFTAGTIDIAASPSVAFTVSAMVPGDTITQAMTIDNDGTADLRWSLSTVATNPLGDALTLTVRQLGTSCAAFDGTVVLAATALDGASIGDEPLPAEQRGWWNLPLEAIGLTIVVWVWRRAGLADGVRRRAVSRSGRLFDPTL